MTTGQPGGGRNLWRDVASVVVEQVADRIRSSNDATRAKSDPSIPRPQTPPTPMAAPAPQPPRIGAELKRLVAQGLAASNDTVAEYQSERERRRAEAPMLKAQSQAATAKAGAIGLGAIGVVMLAGGVSGIAMEAPVQAVPSIVMSVGAGAGAIALNRRGRERQAIADDYACRLGASSASAVSIHGVSAYTVPLPNASSLAYEPTRRFVAQKAALAELLPDVEGVAPELRPLARKSEETLAAYAERIVKLERAQAAAAGSSTLDAPLARAVAQYEEGVEAHQKLVEAAATVMAELVTPHVPDPAHDAIADAADRLQGLADGLREVRYDIPIDRPAARATPPSTGATAADTTAAAPRAPRLRDRHDRRRDLAD